MNKTTVVVLGLGPNGLGVVRSLSGNPELQVRAVYFGKFEPARLTFLAPKEHWNDPQTNENEFIEKLKELAHNSGRIVLFPTRDIEVEIISRHEAELPDSLLFFRNTIDTVKSLLDKTRSVALAEAAKLNVPKTIFPETIDDFPEEGLRFPVIVKPIDSVKVKDFFKTALVKDHVALYDLYAYHKGLAGNSVIQEYIPGGDDCVYQFNGLFDERHEIVAGVGFRKLRQYPRGQGIASFGYTTENKQLAKLCGDLVKTAGYTGLISVEFKHDSRSNKWYFVEANPRLPAYNSVFIKSNCNLAKLYIEKLVGINSKSYGNTKTAYWINEDLDLATLLNGKVEEGVWGWLNQFKKLDAFTYSSLHDPLPGICWAGMFFYKSFKRLLGIKN